MTRTDYEVTNAADVLVYSSSDLGLAFAFIDREQHRHNGLKVERVVTRTTRQVIEPGQVMSIRRRAA